MNYPEPWTTTETRALRAPPPRGCVPEGRIELIVAVGPVTFARFEGAVWVGVHPEGAAPSCEDEMRAMSWIPSSEEECAAVYAAPADEIEHTIGRMCLPLRMRSLRHGAVVACTGRATGQVFGWVEAYRGANRALAFARAHGGVTVFRDGRMSRFSVCS